MIETIFENARELERKRKEVEERYGVKLRKKMKE